jgi:hypothetical protein
MASHLPALPRVVFTIIEPISLLGGFFGAALQPAWFAAQQIPNGAAPASMSDTSILLSLLTGNLYLLLFFIGVAVFVSTSEVKVVRAYLFALWLGDIGHVGISYLGIPEELRSNPAIWNATVWGNIGFTAFLFTMRTLYFLGLFGRDRPLAGMTKKRA